MSKRKTYQVSLVSLGSLNENLHFGPFSQNWWESRQDNIGDNETSGLYLIRINMKTLVFLQNTEFITTTVQGCNGFLQQPGYICEAKNTISNIFDNPSAAITTLYQQLFGSKTRFSEQFYYAGTGFKSSFYYTIGVERKRTFPDDVWQKVEVLQEHKGTELFGICHPEVQAIFQKLQEPKCKPEEWYITGKMQILWNYHLRKFTLASIRWNQFFISWYNERKSIIELITSLKKLYPPNYIFKEREMRVWKAMLSHAGCTNITPYTKKISNYEFWTRSNDPTYDRENINFLYNSGFLLSNNSDLFWDSFYQALNINKKGLDGKRRILSIIAEKFSYNILMEKLRVAHGTIFEARKYARINGPGWIAIEKPIRKLKRITSEQEYQFNTFFQDKANVIMSSYKTDAKTGQPVFYLKNTKNILWEEFKESFPNGLKRTTFYTKLMGHQYVYREDLGGLCATCSTYGYETFEDINTFFQHCNSLKRYLKKEYEEHLIVTDRGISLHNPCINHCLQYAFNECNASHPHVCIECQELFQFFQNLKTNLEQSCHEEVQEYYNKILYYAHQTRKVYLNAQFNAALLDLDENGAILVIDYKMKILPKTSRETKQEFFGKKRMALTYDVTIDHWSIDARQDAWFSASPLHSAIENLEIKPKWISIISDNVGEAKTTVDSHHAQLSLSIKRYIKIGGEIQEGNDITLAIQDVAGTSVAHIEPNRNRGKTKSMTIPGISNWCEWTWPVEGEYAGYIKARAIPNLGNWILFSPSQIQNFVKGEINQPSPQLSESTKPKSPWKIPIPHASKLCPKRLGLQELTSELPSGNFLCRRNKKKQRLVKILDKELTQETLENKGLHLRNRSMLNKKYNTRPMNDEEFPLSSGWATKEVQKYGKKGGGKRIKKRISTILEQYFLAGNVDKSNRMTAQDMWNLLTLKAIILLIVAVVIVNFKKLKQEILSDNYDRYRLALSELLV
ncbi:hypothetical protein Glove_469g42 [Diversispora epigaea]|uniref:Uncharacterized protein n=1 Tax=Diversispora epigaea TaxID=1348612 RepID=A0A397GQ78_9GLOM|nr:hypothetical protein Glove_469g42 [Diversispora epigaea]